jgi:acetyl esterase
MPYAVDPELADFAAAMPVIDNRDAVAARATLDELLAQAPAPDLTGIASIEDREFATGHGELTVRVYQPEERVGDAVIFHIHGGGFIMGNLELNHHRNVAVTRAVGVTMVAASYRLAPEAPYPAALEDVYAGLQWTATHAEELGASADQIIIRGGSAGANLCAALALAARDRGGPTIAFQLLSIPALDDRLNSDSASRFTDTPVINRYSTAACWDAYLGDGVAGGNDVPAYAAPARATDLSGLPPAYIAVAELDPLRDDGIGYAQALLRADVPVELHLFPGTFHGSTMFEDAAVSQRELAEEVTVLRSVITRLVD